MSLDLDAIERRGKEAQHRTHLKLADIRALAADLLEVVSLARGLQGLIELREVALKIMEEREQEADRHWRLRVIETEVQLVKLNSQAWGIQQQLHAAELALSEIDRLIKDLDPPEAISRIHDAIELWIKDCPGQNGDGDAD